MADQISAEALNYLTNGIQAEISAYVFYKIGLDKISDQSVRETMMHFANEERKHFLTLEKLYDQYVRSEKWVTYRDIMNRDGLPEMDETIADKHKRRIDRLKQAQNMMDILEIALELEKEAYALYSEAAKNTTTEDVKKTFEFLTQFELGHVHNVEEMIAKAL